VVKTFRVCDFSRLAVTDWRLRRWRLWFLALMTANPGFPLKFRVAIINAKLQRRYRPNLTFDFGGYDYWR